MRKDKEWAKNEVIKLWGRWMAGGDTIHELNNSVISIIDQLDEPEKVAIPKFVADYIELCKGWNGDRQAYTEHNSGLWFALSDDSYGMPNSVSDWLFNEEKVEEFAKAWLNGYKVEKEQLYVLKLPYINYYYTKVEEENRIGIGRPKSIKEMNSYHFTEEEILTKIPDVPRSLWIKLEVIE